MTAGEKIVKMWHRVGYSVSSQSCGTCLHADKNKWDDVGKGECRLFSIIPFMILRHGICKFHSVFGDKVKHGE